MYLINRSATNLVIREGRATIEVDGYLLLREGEEKQTDILDAVDRGWAEFSETAPSEATEVVKVVVVEENVAPAVGMTAEELKAEKAAAKKTGKSGKAVEVAVEAEAA